MGPKQLPSLGHKVPVRKIHVTMSCMCLAYHVNQKQLFQELNGTPCSSLCLRFPSQCLCIFLTASCWSLDLCRVGITSYAATSLGMH